MWILGNFALDGLFLIFPALLGIDLSMHLTGGSLAMHLTGVSTLTVIYAYVLLALIDSGHIYTTVWRTFFHPEERRSHPIYWLVPALTLPVVLLWTLFKVPYLWPFVAYTTLFHHIRQFYGFNKWYQRLNKRYSKISDYFLYSLCIVPAVAYHFRPGALGHYYTDTDLFLHPNLHIFHVLLGVYAGLVAAWLIYELNLVARGVRELNRFLGLATPAVLYAYCFLHGHSIEEVLFPLLLSHGLGYFGVTAQTMNRTRPRKFPTFGVALVVVCATAACFGSVEHHLEYVLYDISNDYLTAPFLNRLGSGLINGLYLTPLYCHYIFDAFIWKGKHREAKLIFSPTGEVAAAPALAVVQNFPIAKS